MHYDQRFVGCLLTDKGEQHISNEGQIGQEVGVATAGAILAHDRIATPMVADLDSTPMPANQREPLTWGILVRQGAGEVIMRFFGGEASLLYGSFAPQHDEASSEGKIGFKRFDGEGMDASGFDSAVGGLGLLKKGVLFKESKP